MTAIPQPHDTEDKMFWCRHGEQKELEFVKFCRIELPLLRARINPAKLAGDQYAPDLLVADKLADLKRQDTPFFNASRYSVSPQYAVTFNRKDYERYREHYRGLTVYFFIDWDAATAFGVTVQPMRVVGRIAFDRLAGWIEAGKLREHFYERRQERTDGNAKSSFVFDCRRLELLYWRTNGEAA